MGFANEQMANCKLQYIINIKVYKVVAIRSVAKRAIEDFPIASRSEPRTVHFLRRAAPLHKGIISTISYKAERHIPVDRTGLCDIIEAQILGTASASTESLSLAFQALAVMVRFVVAAKRIAGLALVWSRWTVERAAIAASLDQIIGPAKIN